MLIEAKAIDSPPKVRIRPPVITGESMNRPKMLLRVTMTMGRSTIRRTSSSREDKCRGSAQLSPFHDDGGEEVFLCGCANTGSEEGREVEGKEKV